MVDFRNNKSIQEYFQGYLHDTDQYVLRCSRGDISKVSGIAL